MFKKLLLFSLLVFLTIACGTTSYQEPRKYYQQPKADPYQECISLLSEVVRICYDSAYDYSSCNVLEKDVRNTLIDSGYSSSFSSTIASICAATCKLRKEGYKKWEIVEQAEDLCRKAYR